MDRHWLQKSCLGILLFIMASASTHAQVERVARKETPSRRDAEQDFGRPSNLPLPSKTPHEEFESKLFEFLNTRQYAELGWRKDKAVRDTGPFIGGRYYGTHPVVRVFYSPEIMRWLVGGRQGSIPDGAMMIKEQYGRPAAMHEGKNESELWQSLNAWTIMFKDSDGSHDGWYWSNPIKGGKPINNHLYVHNFDHPHSGFGHYCVRCHGSTTSPGATKEYTFAALRNIEGFPGEPIIFRVDDSWRVPEESADTSNEEKVKAPVDSSHPGCTGGLGPTKCATEFNSAFASTFNMINRQTVDQIPFLPPVTHDWVWRAPAERASQQLFVTSNQCMSCHAAMSNELGPSMFVHTSEYQEYGQPGRDYSPYGEWRWTPMGLAGRDPIFMAQMETELALLPKNFKDPEERKQISSELVQTCFRCHGAMGHHQYRHDNGPAAEPFGLQHVMAKSGLSDVPGRDPPRQLRSVGPRWHQLHGLPPYATARTARKRRSPLPAILP